MSEIPSDWKLLPLGEAVDFLDGQRKPVKDADRAKMRGDIPYYGASGIVDYVNTHLFDEDLILLGEDGENILSRNCRLAFKISGKSWVNNHAHVIRPKESVSLDYLVEYLESLNYEQYNTGTAQPKLNKLVCSGIPVLLPPEYEQRAIASALSDVDALIAGLEKLIAKKRDLKQAAMQQLLTGQTRLPGFSGGWLVIYLGHVATFLKGKGLPKSALTSDGGDPCIHYGELFTHYAEIVGEITSRTNGTRDSLRSVANDVLMPTSDVTPRGLAKASCVTLDNVILGGDILVIRSDPSRVFGAFLSYVIRREEDQVLRLVTGSTVYHLYGSDMKKFKFALPSVPEQIAISSLLSEMDAELTTLESRLAKTRDLKQGMMQELLTGRTRLV